MGHFWAGIGQKWATGPEAASFRPFLGRFWAGNGLFLATHNAANPCWTCCVQNWAGFGPILGLFWARCSSRHPAGLISRLRTGSRYFPWPLLGHFWSLSDQKRARNGPRLCSLRAAFFSMAGALAAATQRWRQGARRWGGGGGWRCTGPCAQCRAGRPGIRFPRVAKCRKA